MRRAVPILLAVLFLTAAYVYAWPTASISFFAGVILHVFAGIALLVALILTLKKTLRSAPPVSKLGWLLLSLGGILGGALIFTGTRRHEWPLLYAHIAACVAGGALLAASWAGRRGFLAGTGLDMATAVRNTVDLLGLGIAEAARMASEYPAAFLGLDHELGRIAPGLRANLVLLDDALQVRRTWIEGVSS